MTFDGLVPLNLNPPLMNFIHISIAFLSITGTIIHVNSINGENPPISLSFSIKEIFQKFQFLDSWLFEANFERRKDVPNVLYGNSNKM